MIGDNLSYQLPAEDGNHTHQSSSSDLTLQKPSSDSFACFIRMLGTLSPADRQTLALTLFSPLSSPETKLDPHLSKKFTIQTLEPYDRLEEWLTSFKKRNEFFNFTKTRELEDYADIKQFHRVQHLDYAAPPLTSYKNANIHKFDQDMAKVQTHLSHLTRPIDSTVHAVLASNPMDIEDPVLINIIETFDIIRYNLAFIATEITRLRKITRHQDKIIIPPDGPNDKTPLITHSFQQASGHIGRVRGHGRGRGRFNNMGNRKWQHNNNNYAVNPIENSGNSNNGSQDCNSDTSSSNYNIDSGSNGHYSQRSSTTRGRGRGRGGRQ
ncbi:hypothetical protein EC991_003247 [Linnemannia zychae]|nr:hypothetical protein EC991_003247 [Linnemannia zychae]